MQVEGDPRCYRCFRGRKKCIFPSEAAEDEGVESASASPTKPQSLASKLLSPIRSLRKRKTADLSPESVEAKEASSSSSKIRRKDSSSDNSVQIVPPPPRSQASIYSTMPPPSLVSRGSNISFSTQSAADDFEVQLLRQQLQESQEDLNLARRRWETREALYQSQIAELKSQAGRGRVRRGSR